MKINYTIKNFAGSGLDKTVVMTFDELKENTRGVAEYQSIRIEKLFEALQAGFKIVLPLGIEVQSL